MGHSKSHYQDGCSCQSPVHVNHLLMSFTCSCHSPAHVNHLLMSITCSCQSPAHVNHLFMSITCSCQSPAHVNHLHMSITCSCQSPVHVKHLFMSTTCSCQSPFHVNHPLPSPTNTAHVPSVLERKHSLLVYLLLFTQSHLSPSICSKPSPTPDSRCDQAQLVEGGSSYLLRSSGTSYQFVYQMTRL